MAILITGASGLVGTFLTAFVAEQEPAQQIIALYHHNKPQKSYPNVVFYTCDLLDPTAIQELFAAYPIDYIYHCAALVSFDPADRNALVSMNQSATAQLVDAALEHQIKRMIYVSSIAAIGRDQDAHRALDETLQWVDSKNASTYSRSKHAAEMEVWRGFAEGLSGAIVNPGIVLGEDFWHQSSGKLMPSVAAGLRWYTQGRTAFVDVIDLVRAMHVLMHSNIEHQRFIISAGNFTYQEVFAAMARSLGVPGPQKRASAAASNFLWRFFYIKSRLFGGKPLITKETAHTAHAVYHFSNEKFLEKFPQFQYTPLEKTIERMAAAFLQYQSRSSQ